MSATMKKCLATLAVLLWAPVAYGQGAVPVGDEFQVNTYTANRQDVPAVVGLADGGALAVWQSFGSAGSDSNGRSIQGQRVAADGSALGGEFQVNSYTVDDQRYPAAAGLPGGGFVVLWQSRRSAGSDASRDSIQGQRFAPGGVPAGEQFQVNTFTTDYQTLPSVAALADDGFVVLWQSLGADGSGWGIRGQRYAAGGWPAGGELQVNTYTDLDQRVPSVTALADGGFVATWASFESSASDTSYYGIQGRRYAADGSSLGGEFSVNNYTVGSQFAPEVAGLADGGFVVVWQSDGSNGSDTSSTSIQGRRFAADGSARGGEFQVNTYTTGHQRFPSLAVLGDGGFVALWQSRGSSGSDASQWSIQGRRYGAGGAALGSEFQVNSYTDDEQRTPSVAPLADDGFFAVWQSRGSSGSDSSNFSVQGQRFAAPRFALVGLAGKCLDVQGADPSDGTPVNIFRCHGGENQRWRLELTAAPQRVVGLGDKCLIPDVDHPSGDIRMQIGPCGGPDDLWQLITSGPSSPSMLLHAETALCLDVEGAVPEDRTPTQLFPCHGGDNQVWRPAPEVCTPDSLGLCLNQERFRVDLTWRSFDGTTGSGRAVPAGTDDSGLLWFFEADNWELLIKVLDGCHINDRLWVFAAATTTVEYTLTVTDTALGTVAEYFNPLGTASAAITDTDAFATCSAGTAGFEEAAVGLPPVAEATPIRSGRDVALKGSCVPSLTRMCLSGGRFAVEVEWRDYDGVAGSGLVAGPGSVDSGLFYFFDRDNWEVLVKVLDACHLEDARFLMLAAATTDVEYTLRVTDTVTGVFREYFNPLGTASPAQVDDFYTCQ